MKKSTLSLLLLTLVSPLFGSSDQLDRILDRMAERGQDIQAMRAEILQKKWTEILEEYDQGETGYFLFLRQDEQLFIRKEIQEPQPNSLVVGDGQVVFYQPRIKQAQRYQLGNNRDKAEFLLIGFGSNRETLEQTYDVRLVGSEPLEAGEAHVLELTPKSDEVSAYFTRIVLWIDSKMWLPVQQKLVEPTEDFLLVVFSKIEVNPKISKSDFRLKLPRDVKIVGN